MVIAPDELRRLIIHANETETDRRIGEIETTVAIFLKIGFQMRGLFGAREFAPIVLRERESHLTAHNMERLVQTFPEKHRTQYRSGLDDSFPRVPQSSEIEFTMQAPAYLLEISSRTRCEQMMKEHALLRW